MSGLWGWLGIGTRDADQDRQLFDLEASDPIFSPIDVKKLKQELRPESRGKQRGSEENPPSDTKGLDDVEQQIVTKIVDMASQANSILTSQEQAFQARISALNIQDPSSTIETCVTRAKGELATSRMDAEAELEILRHTKTENQDAHRKFCEDHGLERPASYPDSKLLPYAILLALLLVESLINANLLGEGHERGLIGGFVVAGTIAFVNVITIGGLGGFGLRRILHLDSRHRLAGLSAIILFAISAIVVNLMGAHLRASHINPDVDYAMAEAFRTFVQDPLDVGDVLSWLLAVIGITFAVLAAVDFYKMDDPYPGYGHVDRQLKTAEDDHARALKERIEELVQIRDKWFDKIEDAKEKLMSSNAIYREITNHRTHVRSAFKGHLADLERTANNLLTAYREGNRQMRSTPPPRHFAHNWEMPTTAFPDPVGPDGIDETEKQDIINRADRTRQSGIEDIEQYCSKQIQLITAAQQT